MTEFRTNTFSDFAYFPLCLWKESLSVKLSGKSGSGVSLVEIHLLSYNSIAELTFLFLFE